jgi:hypothetical protein
LLEDLKDRVEEVRAQNANLRNDINDLQGRVSDQQRFAEDVAPYLLPGSLEGVDVVVLEFEGVAGGLVDEVRDEVEQAGGDVASTITITTKFGLEDQTDRDELALDLRSSSSDAEDLMLETAQALGTRAAVVAAPGTPSTTARSRLETLIQELADNGFLSVSRKSDDVTVPAGASFLVLGGGEALPGYRADEFAAELSAALARGRSGVLAAETTNSKWAMTSAILDNSAARDSVATVGGADKVEGRIAVILGLERAINGFPGHYGSGDGADSVLPAPSPSS